MCEMEGEKFVCVCKRENEREREKGRNVITRITKSQTKSEDLYWGRCSCVEEKKQEKKRIDEKKKKTKE